MLRLFITFLQVFLVYDLMRGMGGDRFQTILPCVAPLSLREDLEHGIIGMKLKNIENCMR